MQKILQQVRQVLEKEGALKPGVLADRLSMSRQMMHRYLKMLLEQKEIIPLGEGPHRQYKLATESSTTRVESDFLFCQEHLLPAFVADFDRHYAPLASSFLADKSSEGTLNFGFMIEAAAVYSSNIEGNSLNLNSFLNSQKTPKIHRPKEAQEIEDLVKAYHLAFEHDFCENKLLKAHGILSRDFVAKSRSGVYRQEPVGVFSEAGLQYMGIEPEFVKSEMKILCEKIEYLLEQELSVAESFFWASWTHLTMVLIHPFSDGNGRISRLSEKWFLTQKLGKAWAMFPSEKWYALHRSKYYESLRVGVNYWEVNGQKTKNFYDLLPNAFEIL